MLLFLSFFLTFSLSAENKEKANPTSSKCLSDQGEESISEKKNKINENNFSAFYHGHIEYTYFQETDEIKNIHESLFPVSRKNSIQTCRECHEEIEKDYLEGVHGKDYVKRIKDVPVCIDCHGNQEILSPQDLNSPAFATNVSGVCAHCHDDEALARQYGFLTARLKTYFNSFHGTASKFGETRVANCASCHGYHDIRPSSDPKSSINPKNLPKTCGKCHPGAGVNFAKGKIHVVSEKTSNKWAYFIKTFYIILIASFIFIFLIFIATDFFHRLSQKWKT